MFSASATIPTKRKTTEATTLTASKITIMIIKIIKKMPLISDSLITLDTDTSSKCNAEDKYADMKKMVRPTAATSTLTISKRYENFSKRVSWNSRAALESTSMALS